MVMLPVWPDLAKFRHIGKHLNFGQYLECFFRIWQNFETTLANFYDIGQMFIAVNGRILNK